MLQALYTEVDAFLWRKKYSLIYSGKDLFSYRKSRMEDLFHDEQTNDVILITEKGS